MANKTPLPPLPGSWSALSWQQLMLCWQVKQRYGGNPDVARPAALLALLGLTSDKGQPATVAANGETAYVLKGKDGSLWQVTPRELSYYAKRALPWYDFPYGDPGEKQEKDEKGNVIKERREPVAGYVSPMRDAMGLPVDSLSIGHGTLSTEEFRRPWWRRMFSRHFALPQVACNNLTWQQYRSLQPIVQQLFGEDVSEEDTVRLHAEFLAHCLVPRSFALLDTAGGSIRIRPHSEYHYNTEQAEWLARWFEKKMVAERKKWNNKPSTFSLQLSTLYHICFQCYQTALQYYSLAYPLLFSDSGNSDTMRDALQSEVGTINTIMKYAGYAEQQQVYESNLPFVLDILNTMAKEAKEMEKIKSKSRNK